MTRPSKTVNVNKHPESVCESNSDTPLADAACFIETQFPVAKVSAESYAERRSNQSQSITSLGKWWGRKPLVLVRATLLGLLLPTTKNPEADCEIFLKLMTMDDEGLRRRKNRSIPQNRLLEDILLMPPSIQKKYLQENDSSEPSRIRRLSREERQELQLLVFTRMSYSEKMKYCCRPEELSGPSESAWESINAHLGTESSTLSELIEELGLCRFGHRPRVGDVFCGAGSVPFEAARLGCDVYGSDLSPVASLLTLAAIRIVGGNTETIECVTESQRCVYEKANQQLLEWGIDQNDKGWRIDALLYCSEVIDPETGWLVPLAPHWIIAPTSRVVACLVPNERDKRYEIELIHNALDKDIEAARESGTIRDGYLFHPALEALGKEPASIDMIRAAGRGLDIGGSYSESGLRLWVCDDIVPRPTDVFQERLYCIRWIETYYERDIEGDVVELSEEEARSLSNFEHLVENGWLKERTRRHYRAPTEMDLLRESRVLDLLRERLSVWKEKHYIPTHSIQPGYNTSQPIRERGWTYWHHLFTPRQLLTAGLLQSIADVEIGSTEGRIGVLLSVARFVDWNSKLCRWGTGAARESIGQTFTNQALNTLHTFASKGFKLSSGTWYMRLRPEQIRTNVDVRPIDGRTVTDHCDLWITDPPYADAINYHEVTEFFLAWYGQKLEELFPTWYGDSKRVLAVRGNDNEFRQSMVACYHKMATLMPSNGLQVVMFTHQDASVWADLATILWASGLHVTAAWCIQTEREAAGVRVGNYVQGTVLMILRKRTSDEKIFLDEINHRVEAEVRSQLDNMLALEDDSDPNFTDADYQLAAYAAALRVLTERPIEEIDPAREILRNRPSGEIGPVERLIRNAVKIACDHLVPDGIDRDMWKTLAPMERFYLKGLEVETHGEHRSGVYQELARGFGAADYTDLLQSDRANQTRLKTARELERRMLSGEGFAGSLTRQCLFAVYQVTHNEQVADGLNWLKTELSDYWTLRGKILHILDFLGRIDRVSGMDHWNRDGDSARLLAGMVRNDHI